MTELEQAVELVLFLCFLEAIDQSGSGKETHARSELIAALKNRLTKEAPGTDWLITGTDPLALEQTFPGTPAEHLLLLVGPDCEELERQAIGVQRDGRPFG